MNSASIPTMNTSPVWRRVFAALVLALWLAVPWRAHAQSLCLPGGSCPAPVATSAAQPTQPAEYHHAVLRVVAGAGAIRSAGTGTLIASDGEQGIVLTAAHVIGSNSQATAVWPDGYKSTGRVLCVETRDDIAAFAVIPPADAVVLPLAGDDEWPRAGDTVELCGYGGSNSGTERLRHWSAVAQGYAESRSGRHHTLSVATQTISGDSGGPMVKNGKVVAVLWGGPLAGPRGPMIATHGTYCGRIREIFEGCGLGGTCEPRPTPPIPYPQSPVPNPQSPTIDYERLADLVVARLKEDESFRGPPGPAGATGPPGPMGPQGSRGASGSDGATAEVDLDKLAEAVQQRIIKSIRVRVERE